MTVKEKIDRLLQEKLEEELHRFDNYKDLIKESFDTVNFMEVDKNIVVHVSNKLGISYTMIPKDTDVLINDFNEIIYQRFWKAVMNSIYQNIAIVSPIPGSRNAIDTLSQMANELQDCGVQSNFRKLTGGVYTFRTQYDFDENSSISMEIARLNTKARDIEIVANERVRNLSANFYISLNGQEVFFPDLVAMAEYHYVVKIFEQFIDTYGTYASDFLELVEGYKITIDNCISEYNKNWQGFLNWVQEYKGQQEILIEEQKQRKEEEIKRINEANKKSYKHRIIALLLCLPFGLFGVHLLYTGANSYRFRFTEKQIVLFRSIAVIASFILGLDYSICFFVLLTFGLWWIIDLILIILGKFKDGDGKVIVRW